MFILKSRYIIDGVKEKAMENGIIVVKGEKIEFVGEDSSFKGNRRGAEVIDFEEKTIMPGMMDAHVHPSFNGEPDFWDIVLTKTDPYRTVKALVNLQNDLIAGFTTIRALGEKSDIDIALREAIDQGLVKGPRMVCAGKNITVTGGHTDLNFVPDIKNEQGLGGVTVDGTEEMQKAVRAQIKAGADLIKLMVTGGVTSKGSGPTTQYMSEEEISAAVKEAHNLGKKVTVHAQGAGGIKSSVLAGVDCIEHGYYLDREIASLMAEKGVFYVPTWKAGSSILKEEIKAQLPDYILEKAEKIKEVALDSFRYAIEENVSIVAGTDVGCPFNHHGENAQELELMVKAGLSEIEAIKTATKNAAVCFGVEEFTGTLETGKFADIICVDGNPLKDIKACQKVTFVMKNGEVVVNNGKSVLPL